MMNPYETSQAASTAKQKHFALFRRPQSSNVFAFIFVLVFIGGLFIPTVEFFQNNYSWGHLPLWYAYVGLLAPEYWIIAIPIVAGHVVGTTVLASLAERYLTPLVRGEHPNKPS